jgi:hypothetical protein
MIRVGSRLGPYEIVSSLDAGGISEVYRACHARRQRPRSAPLRSTLSCGTLSSRASAYEDSHGS